MIDLGIKILAFVVAISVLVAVHEFGHYWVARRLGFKVERFSIGFGRALWRWYGKDADAVEYQVAAIPLGGYVKLLDERDAPEGTPDLDRAFNRRPVLHRIAVLAAGPGINFLFAIVAFWVLYLAGVPDVKPYVFDVAAESPAAAAGLRADDLIETVGDRSVATWTGATYAILDEIFADGVIELRVLGADLRSRNVEIDVRGRAGELSEPDALFDELGIALRPVPPPIAGQITADGAAQRAGLLPGDTIRAIDGETISDFIMLAEHVRARPGETAVFTIEREARLLELEVMIGSVDEAGERVGRIGVGPISEWPEATREKLESLQTMQQFGPIAAFSEAVDRTWDTTMLTLRLIGGMITGEVSLRSVSGPITIADYAGDYARAGLRSFLSFLGLVSISLGIFNLLPIPILDGGQIVMQAAEWIRGGPLPERIIVLGQQLGIVLFILIFSFVFYNDLTRVFS
jgi:regulator of sigma E protease